MPPLCTRFSAVRMFSCWFQCVWADGFFPAVWLAHGNVCSVTFLQPDYLFGCRILPELHFLNFSLEVFPVSPLAFSQGCKVIFPKGILNFKHSTHTHIFIIKALWCQKQFNWLWQGDFRSLTALLLWLTKKWALRQTDNYLMCAWEA